jgi:hypothetical protein
VTPHSTLHRHAPDLPPSARELEAARLKALACRIDGAGSFAELAALALARQFVKRGRPRDARRVLAAFLQRHGASPRVEALASAL